MAQVCELCGKTPQVGHKISHANNKSKRRWKLNLKRVKALVGKRVQHIRICTRCIRSGKFVKAA